MIRVDNIAFEGAGVGRSDGLVVFIPFTLPGELVLVSSLKKKKNFATASLLKVIESSPHRESPPCPYFLRCGGCQLQHSSYLNQVTIKRQFVEDSLLRIGKISFPIPSVIPSPTPLAYRRHLSLQMHFLENSWKLCFTSLTLDPLPINSCLLLHEKEDPIIESLGKAIGELPATFPLEGRLKLFKVPKGYIVACTLKKNLTLQQEQELFSLLLEISLGVYIQTPEKTLQKGLSDLSFTHQNLHFSYSPFGFVQNHPEQTENILDLILSLLKNSKKVLDLYCGIGVSTLLLANQGKDVIGIEISPESIRLAKENGVNNNLPQVPFFCGSAEIEAKKVLSSFLPDSILVNPPKTGLDPEVRNLLNFLSVKQIVYVSCHPPTLARDLAFLQTLGFTLCFLQSFDCFPQTTHVETVVQLVRN